MIFFQNLVLTVGSHPSGGFIMISYMSHLVEQEIERFGASLVNGKRSKTF